jgi:hypothetical protein
VACICFAVGALGGIGRIDWTDLGLFFVSQPRPEARDRGLEDERQEAEEQAQVRPIDPPDPAERANRETDAGHDDQ